MKLLFLASLASLLLQVGNPAPGTRGRVEGTVIRIGTGQPQPIPKARVTLSLLRCMPATLGPPVPCPVEKLIAALTSNVEGVVRVPRPPVITDSKGKFEFQNLEEGLYDVKVEADGYIGEGSSLELSAGETVNDLSIDMTPVATVSGRIRDASGEPLVDAPVQLVRPGYNFDGVQTFKSSGVVRTNDHGEFRLFWLNPGRYYLLAGNTPSGMTPMDTAIAESFGRSSASGTPVERVGGYVFYPGVTDFAAARTLDLQPGSDLKIELALTPKPRAFTVNARIVDPRTGQPPPRATVFVVWENGPRLLLNNQLMGSHNYDAKTGISRIRDLLPGTYTIAAWVQQPAVPGQVGASPQYLGTTRVTIANTDLDVAIATAPAVSISGSLRLEGSFGANVSFEGFRVLIRPVGPHGVVPRILQNESFYQGAPVASDGSFRLTNIAAGDYRVEIQDRMPGGGFLKVARFEAADALETPIHVGGANNQRLELTFSSNSGKISGTVLDASLQPVQSASVLLVPERARFRPDLYLRDTTGEGGRFTFSGVPPGDYRVFSWESIAEFEWFDPNVLREFELKGTYVHVSESSTSEVTVKQIPAVAR